MSNESMKQCVGEKAAQLIEDNMCVGIGTGSTTHFFIQALGRRIQEGLKGIEAIASSTRSKELAHSLNIPILSSLNGKTLDITVDGADVVMKDGSLIKGGGGALLREKIIATAAKQFIVIVDETKLASKGALAVWPVEITPFAHDLTIQAIDGLNLKGSLRKNSDNTLYITDNGNLIYDIDSAPPFKDYSVLHSELLHIAGVVETGFFPPIHKKIIVADSTLSTYEIC